jgi:hypothetical protein
MCPVVSRISSDSLLLLCRGRSPRMKEQRLTRLRVDVLAKSVETTRFSKLFHRNVIVSMPSYPIRPSRVAT